jgi:4-amino-4-deoxy-L-arabinose transferase-like glycosyltransferase
VALFVTAAALRVGAALFFPAHIQSDSTDYVTLGTALAQGRGYVELDGSPHSFRPPLYPLFVAAVFRVSDFSVVAVRLAQVVLDLATCLIIWYWARQRWGERAALWSLALAATSLTMIASVRCLLSECLASLLITASVALVDLARDRLRRPYLAYGAAGAVAGLLTLTRSNTILFPLFMVVIVCLARRKLRPSLAASALLLVGYTAAITPWMIRNREVLGAAVITTQGGIGLYSSHFLTAGQHYGELTNDETVRATKDMGQVERSRYLTRVTVEKLEQQPAVFFRAIPRKLVYFFVPIDWEILGDGAYHGTVNFGYIAIVILGMFGVRAMARDDRLALLGSLLPLCYFALMSIPLYGSPRFRAPAEPFLTPVAAGGLIGILDRLKQRVVV